MGLREDQIRAHPDFPWLDADDAAGVASYLESRGFLAKGERFLHCERAGEGNMNLTLRIHTSARRFILKQSRPWVEKFPEIEAPWERSQSELRFYERAKTIPGVAERMPTLIAGEGAARVLLLEDLADARDLTSLYSEPGETLRDEEIDALAASLAALHAATRGSVGEEFANREMRALNHAHLFGVPLDPDNGLDLDALEGGLGAAAKDLMGDLRYRKAVTETADRYLRDGPCLVHADFFPGSWLRTREGMRVIDPEFSFPGDPEVDLGCAVAHMALAQQPLAKAERFITAYSTEKSDLDAIRLARYAAVEVMRRLIGVAQLPLPASPPGASPGPRARLLARSRQAMCSGQMDELFEDRGE